MLFVQKIKEQGAAPAIIPDGLQAHLNIIGLKGQALAVLAVGSFFVAGIVEFVNGSVFLIPAVHEENRFFDDFPA